MPVSIDLERFLGAGGSLGRRAVSLGDDAREGRQRAGDTDLAYHPCQTKAGGALRHE